MSRAPTLVLSAAGAGFLALGAALWTQYGDGVFYDWISAAIAGCFS